MGQTILVVDDEPANLRVLSAMLAAQGYHVLEASSGHEALERAAADKPDLILLDIMMPQIDGFEVTRRLKAAPATRAIPIIMVTALDDRESKLKALEHGAEEFLTKPVDRAELWIRVRNLLRLKEFNDFLANHNRILDEQVRWRTVELRHSYRETIHTLARAAEYRDEDTGAHVARISHYSLTLCQELDLPEETAEAIFHASPMHDVGKIGIPDAVLFKPGPLSPEEWGVMRRHPEFGAKILTFGRSPYLKMGSEIALFHHERFSGGGYPQGLAGEAIPLPARIVHLCDQYDALRMQRPYKPAFDHDRAVAIITEGDGRTDPRDFDPEVLAAFRRCAPVFKKIFGARQD